MKKLLAIVIALAVLLPTMVSWLPHKALDNLQAQIVAQHQGAFGHGHGLELQTDKGEHPIHLSPVSFFEYLHLDLKNPSPAKFVSAQGDLQDMPIILVGILLLCAPLLLVRRSQGPPMQGHHRAALGIPVYLATQRLRI